MGGIAPIFILLLSMATTCICPCINTQLLPGAVAITSDSLSSMITSRSPLVDTDLYSSLSKAMVCRNLVCRNRESPFERNTVVAYYKLGMNEQKERKAWIIDDVCPGRR